MKYYVIVQEILERIVTVEAESPEEAELVVYDKYIEEEIILDFDDHIDTIFHVSNADNDSEVDYYAKK